MIDLTSKTKILPDGNKFPDTPMPIIIRENFGSIEVSNPNKSDFYVGDSTKRKKSWRILGKKRGIRL